MNTSDPTPPSPRLDHAAASDPDALPALLAAQADRVRQRMPDLAEAYDRVVARLRSIDRGAIGPALGASMPEFLLPDQDGRLIALETLLRRGPVVISINRGHWCPFCKLDLRALAAAHGDIADLGASVVSIMPETAQFTRTAMAESDLPFPILTDIDLSYLLSLDLIYWIGPEVEAFYEQIGLDLERYQGNGRQFLPMAAKFVLAADGRVIARQVDLDFRMRMDASAVVAALQRERG